MSLKDKLQPLDDLSWYAKVGIVLATFLLASMYVKPMYDQARKK